MVKRYDYNTSSGVFELVDGALVMYDDYIRLSEVASQLYNNLDVAVLVLKAHGYDCSNQERTLSQFKDQEEQEG